MNQKSFLSFILILIGSSLGANADLELPFDIRNQYAPFILVLQPRPTTPKTIGEGNYRIHTNFALTNETISSSNYQYTKDYYPRRYLIYQAVRRDSRTPLENIIAADIAQFGNIEYFNQTVVDMEYMNFQFGMDFGIRENLDLGFRINIYSFNHGIFDHTINDYHSLIRVKTGKERFPNGDFKYRISGAKKEIISSKPRTGPGDSSVLLKWKPKQIISFLEFSYLFQVKLPTGDLSLAMGNGKADFSSGISIKHTMGNWNQFFNIFAVVVGDPFSGSTIHLRNYGLFSYSLSYRFSKSLSGIIQVDTHSSPYRSQTVLLSQVSSVFSTGINWAFSENSIWQIGFSEDITYPVPDISVFYNVKYTF